MKKHLTLLAATAILAAMTGVASASLDAGLGTKMTLSVDGKFEYAVEYDPSNGTWTNGADQTIGDQSLKITVNVPSTSTSPKLWFEIKKDGDGHMKFNNATFEQYVLGKNLLKLGNVGFDVNDNVALWTWGPGAQLVIPYNALNLELTTVKDRWSNSQNRSVSNALGVKAGYKLNADGSNNINFALAVDPVMEGAFGVYGTYKVSPVATVKGSYAVETHPAASVDAKDDFKSVKVDVVPSATWNFGGAAYQVDKNFRPLLGWQDIYWGSGDINANRWDSAWWLNSCGLYDNMNLTGYANYNLANAAGKLYVNGYSYANNTMSFKAGMQYLPIKLDDAFVAKTTYGSPASTAQATFKAPVGPFTVYAGVGMKSFEDPTKDVQSYGLLKAETSVVGGLYTYAQIVKDYAAEKPATRVGLSYTLDF